MTEEEIDRYYEKKIEQLNMEIEVERIKRIDEFKKIGYTYNESTELAAASFILSRANAERSHPSFIQWENI